MSKDLALFFGGTMRHFIYATTNKGKIEEVTRHLAAVNILVRSINDFGIPNFDVPETGSTLGENAELKVRAYLKALQDKADLRGQKFVVVSDDTGIFIDKLHGKPGIHVRRWKGYRMTDREIIDHALSELQSFQGDERAATFKTVLAAGVLQPDGNIKNGFSYFSGSLSGRILEEEVGESIEGFPFAQLFFVREWGMHLGAAQKLPPEKKKYFFDHRERAISDAVPYIGEHLGV
jgi:XTP/dITP diphosphohydrolase